MSYLDKAIAAFLIICFLGSVLGLIIDFAVIRSKARGTQN